MVTIYADGTLWSHEAASAAADASLVAQLDSSGVETSAAAIAGSAARCGPALSATGRRVAAIRAEIEQQLLRDGLQEDRLHLVGGDEADEEATVFESAWQRAYVSDALGQMRAAERGADQVQAALEALKRLRERSGSQSPLCIGLVTDGPATMATLSSTRELAAVDFVHSAEEDEAVNGVRMPARFDAVLRRAWQTIDATVPPQAAPGLRWIHVGTELHGADALGARTVQVRRSSLAADRAPDEWRPDGKHVAISATGGLDEACASLIDAAE